MYQGKCLEFVMVLLIPFLHLLSPSVLASSICSTIFIYCHQRAFYRHFGCAYLSGIFFYSDWCYRAVHLYSIQTRTPLLGQVLPSYSRPLYPSIQVLCVIGLAFIATMGFVRRLITHCSGFPIQVIPRLPRILSTESSDPGTCRVCFQLQGGRYETWYEKMDHL
jgi:hypothetical protein